MPFINQNHDILLKGLNAEALRYKVISNNIANVDTPHFKKSNVVFESSLRKALNNSKNPFLDIIKTHPKHFSSAFTQLNYKDVNPKIVLDYNTSYRNDKNNVDIDVESNLALKSSLRYQAFSDLMSRNFKKMKYLLNINV